MTDYKISIRQLIDVLKTGEFDTEYYGEAAKVGFDNAITRMLLYLYDERNKQANEEFKKSSADKEQKSDTDI